MIVSKLIKRRTAGAAVALAAASGLALGMAGTASATTPETLTVCNWSTSRAVDAWDGNAFTGDQDWLGTVGFAPASGKSTCKDFNIEFLDQEYIQLYIHNAPSPGAKVGGPMFIRDMHNGFLINTVD